MMGPEGKKVPNYPPYEEDEIDLYELYKRLKKRKRVIILSFLTFMLGAIIYVFIATPIYTSETVLLPVSSKPISPIGDLAGKFLGISLQQSDTTQKIKAILHSRTFRERIAKRLNLHEIIFEKLPEKIPPEEAAAGALKKIIDIQDDRKTGTIKLLINYKDPEVAQKIGFTAIDVLREIMEEKAITLAKFNRIFLEKQVKETEKELKESVAKLTQYQKREKVLVPEEQVKGTFELYSTLLASKIQLEIQLRNLKEVLSPESPQIRNLEEQLRAVESQLARLESEAGGFSAIPTLGEAPEKIAEYSQIFVKVKALQAKYETLLKMYEQAKIEEQKENIYVEVIDPPSLPRAPSKPKKNLILAVTAVSSVILGVFLALFIDWVNELRSRESEAVAEDQ